MKWLEMARWSPIVVGAGIGLLNVLAFLLSNKALGCSTAYARTAGMIESAASGGRSRTKPYYQKFVPEIDWQWMLVLGIVIGALLSAVLSGTFKVTWVPQMWLKTFGNDPVMRWFQALMGGMIMGFGARWAGGCTSGHGLSGTAQLTVGSWVAAMCFFAGGIATAFLLYPLTVN
jgi:uncharacterized membrane protein YedE/YeeE